MRNSGLLMPVFSLPSEYGIGDFGEGAYKFVDLLKKSKQHFWQVLPLVQTGYGNSPYSSVSSMSINPYFISPDILLKKGLCLKEEVAFSKSDSEYIDYGFLYSVRFPLLKKAFSRFDRGNKEFIDFVNEKTAYDYALFMTLKEISGQKHFYEWEDKYKYRDKNALTELAINYSEDVLFWQFVQFEARKEWLDLKSYANNNGVEIIGDIPLYVALDSVDVWCNPKNFKIDEKFVPKKVAGVPPDYFCADGQLWGNPVYDYDYIKSQNFSFWTTRLKEVLSIFDYVRIDHFRGLNRYFEIDYGETTARNGKWLEVPEDELFFALHNKIDKSRIIAEDLGIIDDGVRNLLKKTGYPGMKILLFAFNGEPNNLYLPQNIEENYICYTGTHDNDTLLGYILGAQSWDYNNLLNGVKNSLSLYNLNYEIQSKEDLINAIIELGFLSKAKTMILPVHDLLKKDNSYRINEPGTVKPQNWAVKYKWEDFGFKDFDYLRALTIKYKRG